MTGKPGAAAATQDGEVPELSLPCSPSYDLTSKVGGHCVQRRRLLCGLRGPSLPAPFGLRPWGSREEALFWLRLSCAQLFPQAAKCPSVEREGPDTAPKPIPASWDPGWLYPGWQRKLGSDIPTQFSSATLWLMIPRGDTVLLIRVNPPGRRDPRG